MFLVADILNCPWDCLVKGSGYFTGKWLEFTSLLSKLQKIALNLIFCLLIKQVFLKTKVLDLRIKVTLEKVL